MIINILSVILFSALLGLPIMSICGLIGLFYALDSSLNAALVWAIILGLLAVVVTGFIFYYIPDFLPKKLKTVKEQNAFLIMNCVVDIILGIILLFLSSFLWVLPFVCSSFYSVLALLKINEYEWTQIDFIYNAIGIVTIIADSIFRAVIMRLGFNKLNKSKYWIG